MQESVIFSLLAFIILLALQLAFFHFLPSCSSTLKNFRFQLPARKPGILQALQAFVSDSMLKMALEEHCVSRVSDVGVRVSARQRRLMLRCRCTAKRSLHLFVVFTLVACLSFAPTSQGMICVETEHDVFLCTDDMQKARSAAMKRKDNEPVYFATNLDLGVDQRNDGKPHEQKAVREHMERVEAYFQTVVLADSQYDDVRDQCKNGHELCTFWAALSDECKRNPGYMRKDCAAACMSCDQLRVA